MTNIAQYEFIDSYEKALAFYVLQIEKSNNEFLNNLDVSSLTTNDYIYYLKYCCNVGIIINDFDFSFSFVVPFDQDNFLDSNGEFYDSIISSTHLTNTSTLPLPFFQSIFTYVELANPPEYLDSLEKYIVWLGYQMQKGGAATITIEHRTNTDNALADFLIDSRNLRLMEKKADYLNNATFPQYITDVNLGYVKISHRTNIDKNLLFRFGNFSNSVLPEISTNPQVVASTQSNISINFAFDYTEKHTRIFKPLNNKWLYGTRCTTTRSLHVKAYRQFADYASISSYHSTGGALTSTWESGTTFDSTYQLVKYQFSWLVSRSFFQSQHGKLDSRVQQSTEYLSYSSFTKIEDVVSSSSFKTVKNYVYKNLIR